MLSVAHNLPQSFFAFLHEHNILVAVLQIQLFNSPLHVFHGYLHLKVQLIVCLYTIYIKHYLVLVFYLLCELRISPLAQILSLPSDCVLETLLLHVK